jgi:aldehyde dehydrogenase (NAD+)
VCGGARADGDLATGNSGLGREGGRAAIESYTELKTVLLPFTGEMM